MLAACEKKENKLGKKYAQIQVVLTDITNDESSPENVTVRIKKQGSDDYFYEQTTDESGVVNFIMLDEDSLYEVSASIEVNNITYTGKQDILINNKDEDNGFVLQLRYDDDSFNLLQIRCEDDLGAPLPTVDVCLFLSSYLADSADCSTSVYSQITGNDGFVNFWNSSAGTYYLGIRDTIGGFPVDTVKTYQINESGSMTDTLVFTL